MQEKKNISVYFFFSPFPHYFFKQQLAVKYSTSVTQILLNDFELFEQIFLAPLRHNSCHSACPVAFMFAPVQSLDYINKLYSQFRLFSECKVMH